MTHQILEFKKENRHLFEQLRNGSKHIETRAVCDTYLNIKEGDTLAFVCEAESFNKKVKKIIHFKSISEIVESIPIEEVMPGVKTLEEMTEIYFSFPGYSERINKAGILAFYLE